MIKSVKDFSSFAILADIVLVLCCISTSAYASSDDELTIRVEPWFPILDIPVRGGQINLEDIMGLNIKYALLPKQPRFNGVPPINIGVSLFDSYTLSDDEPWGIPKPIFPPHPSIIVIGEADGSLEYILPPDYQPATELPRLVELPPLDVVTLFNSYNTNASSSETIITVPEPATLLLLGFGSLVLRRKR